MKVLEQMEKEARNDLKDWFGDDKIYEKVMKGDSFNEYTDNELASLHFTCGVINTIERFRKELSFVS